MKIIPTQNFAHVSGRVFCIGLEYEVTEKSAEEFVKAGLAVEMKAKPTKAKPAEKYIDVTPPAEMPDTDREVY
jgi:hypothetical protein